MIRLYIFLITIAIFTAMLYVGFVSVQPKYEVQDSLLLVPKSEVLSESMDFIVNDIVFVSSTILKDENIDANIDRLDNHNIIEISVYTNESSDIANVKKDVLRIVLQQIDKYYELKNGISVHVVDSQPLQERALYTAFRYLVLVTTFVGVVSAVLLIIQLLHNKQEKTVGHIDGGEIFKKYKKTQSSSFKNNIDVKEHYEGFFDKQEDIVETDDEMAKKKISKMLENKTFKEEQVEYVEDVETDENNDVKDDDVKQKVNDEVKENNIEENIVSENATKDSQQHSKNSSSQDLTGVSVPEGLATTPGNLPVIDPESLGFSVSSNDEEGQCENFEAEPTEEELKKRLNELLNGKM